MNKLSYINPQMMLGLFCSKDSPHPEETTPLGAYLVQSHYRLHLLFCSFNGEHPDSFGTYFLRVDPNSSPSKTHTGRLRQPQYFYSQFPRANMCFWWRRRDLHPRVPKFITPQFTIIKYI